VAKATEKVWVLTRSINDYNQEGEYFVAVFAQRPTVKTLADYFTKNGGGQFADVMAAVSFLEHVIAGGGRRGTEHEWYDLEETVLL